MGLSHAIRRFVLLPSAVGMICSACGTEGKPSAETSAEASAVERSSETLGSESLAAQVDALTIIPTPSSESPSEAANKGLREKAQAIATQAAYQEGINLASSAYSLSQSAVSPDDWGLVASRWQRASEQLKLVSASSENYAAAQAKIAEYEGNAQYATERIAALQAAANAPLPERTAPPLLSRPIRQSSDRTGEGATSSSPLRAGSNDGSRIAALPSGARSATAAIATESNTVRIPVVRRLHGTPVVHVLFNDSKTYEMILDTGASRTLITRDMATALGVVPNDRMIAATASASQVTFDLGQMRSISIEGVRLNNAQVSIGDSVDIGLLGNDFLRGYDVTIRDREVELSPSR